MKNKKSILIGMLLIVFSILIALIGYQRVNEREVEEKVTMQMKEERKLEMMEAPNLLFEVIGLSEDVFYMLGETDQDLAEFLRDWTYYNGFSRAKRASFYPDIVYNANEKTFLLECQLDDEDQTILTVKYEQHRKKWEAYL